MELTLYSGIAFSPQAELTDNIGAADTIIRVTDASVFPDAPNLATIGTDKEGETILYTAKTADSLSGCRRGVEGTARMWQAGEVIGRNFTAKDHGDLIAAVAALLKELEDKQDALTGSAGQVVGFGTDGRPEPQGTEALVGPPGADGKSAYQIAQEGGYAGTEEAFGAALAEQEAVQALTAQIQALRSEKENKLNLLGRLRAEALDAKSSIVGAVRSMGGVVDDTDSFLSGLGEAIKSINLPAQYRVYQIPKKFPYVAMVKPIWRARGISTVDIYATAVTAGNHALSTTQRNEISEWVESWPFHNSDHADLINYENDIGLRGMNIRVLGPTLNSIPISLQLDTSVNTDENHTAVRSALEAFFSPYLLGKGVTLEELKQAIGNVLPEGTYMLVSPTADTAASATIIPILGSVTFL